MTIDIKLLTDPTPAFRDYLTAHFTALEKKMAATQASLDSLTTAMATLVTGVADINTNVLAVLAKLAAGGDLTSDQHAQLDAAVTALQEQNTAIDAIDTQLKNVLP